MASEDTIDLPDTSIAYQVFFEKIRDGSIFEFGISNKSIEGIMSKSSCTMCRKSDMGLFAINSSISMRILRIKFDYRI